MNSMHIQKYMEKRFSQKYLSLLYFLCIFLLSLALFSVIQSLCVLCRSCVVFVKSILDIMPRRTVGLGVRKKGTLFSSLQYEFRLVQNFTDRVCNVYFVLKSNVQYMV